jgi:hypothetical protein
VCNLILTRVITDIRGARLLILVNLTSLSLFHRTPDVLYHIEHCPRLFGQDFQIKLRLPLVGPEERRYWPPPSAGQASGQAINNYIKVHDAAVGFPKRAIENDDIQQTTMDR